MNKSGKYEKDILPDYFNRERIEKAPEGFTGFNFPGWLIYLAVGLFVLTLLDRAL